MVLILLSVLYTLLLIIATQRRYYYYLIALLIYLLVIYLEGLDSCIYTIVPHLGIKWRSTHQVVIALYSSQLGVYNRIIALAIIVLTRPIVSLLTLYPIQPEYILISIIIASKVNRPYNIFNAFFQVSKVIYGVKMRVSIGREFPTVRLAIRRRYRHCFSSKLIKL